MLATYAYDDLGNRARFQCSPCIPAWLRASAFGNSASETYAYDPVSRLATLTNNLASTSNDLTIGGSTSPIAYNAASQITSAPRSNDAYSYAATGSLSHTFGVNSLNQYISNYDGTTTKTLTYDRNGNLTSDGTNSFCYSSENLLKGMNGTCAAPSVALSYDPLTRLSQDDQSAPSPNGAGFHHGTSTTRRATHSVAMTVRTNRDRERRGGNRGGTAAPRRRLSRRSGG